MSRAAQPTGYVLYRGPSLLDGAPIVAIAIVRSKNRKTGDMVQTYIMRADVAPLDALKSGADASVCGQCKHRPKLGGACYVNVGQGPRSVYVAFLRGRYPDAGSAMASTLGAGRMVRLGTYGDPMAVPARVWQALTFTAAGRTGYTHQWANQAIAQAQRDAIASLCMASADTPDEAHAARSIGRRYFRIRLATEALGPKEFACPASEEQGKRLNCATCGACNGSAQGKASPVIIVHGSTARRYREMRAA